MYPIWPAILYGLGMNSLGVGAVIPTSGGTGARPMRPSYKQDRDYRNRLLEYDLKVKAAVRKAKREREEAEAMLLLSSGAFED